MNAVSKTLLAAVFTVGTVSAASAAPISLDTWYTAAFGDTFPSALVVPPFSTTTNPDGVAAPTPPWTITLTKPGTLTVVDLQVAGDEFEFFDNGVSLGVTSSVANGVSNIGSDVGAALADPAYSRGVFGLAAGDHSITGRYLGDINNGDVAFIVSQVPVPASALLLGTALLGAGYGVRRRKD